MNLWEAQSEIKKLLSHVKPSDVRGLLTWIRCSDEFDDFLSNNQTKVLKNISEDLRGSLPPDAMFSSEVTAYNKMQQCSRPTIHVDSFLYDEDQVDFLYFISHSFSISELCFLFENVLPDLSGQLVVDVGSRLGTVLYGGHVFSSASQLIGLEINEEFVKLQNNILQKYKMTDRIQVLHTDVLLQNVLLQKADVLILNNVFEFFMEPSEQVRAWRFVMENFRKKGSLLVCVPGLQESLNSLQVDLQLGWVEELPVDHKVYLGGDMDQDALTQIHLYRVM
uniref:Zgc:109986 n=1 Tax=Gasterosteus aculeatus aculeatus TaxID=481459 RepID=A0AAQ4RY99_GASAC